VEQTRQRPIGVADLVLVLRCRPCGSAAISRVNLNDRIPPSTCGTLALMRSLAACAARAVSPASRRLPASKNSFDQL